MVELLPPARKVAGSRCPSKRTLKAPTAKERLLRAARLAKIRNVFTKINLTGAKWRADGKPEPSSMRSQVHGTRTLQPDHGGYSCGGDCSGLETLAHACNAICLPIQHRFSSELDVHARQMILETHGAPEVLYKDVCARCVETCPEVDIYGAGFPCQPFSSQGYKAGIFDPRGLVITHIMKYVSYKLPRIVIFENVLNLVSAKHSDFFDLVLKGCGV
jgi:hypothetical protein